MKTVLVTGGAGYIGSHFVALLAERGVEYVVLDDLSRGTRQFVPPGRLIVGNVGDTQTVVEICHKYNVDVAVHFAAYAYVEESVADPALYYENNVVNGVRFLNALRQAAVSSVVFSSSCATYGIPNATGKISETTEQSPINPYGFTKLAFERLLCDYDIAYGIRSICLRYFNASGASMKRDLYERHQPETHFIPRAVAAALQGEAIRLNGSDYATRDGTCERDYVHVDDLATAHLSAVNLLREGQRSDKINLGIGRGYTLLEVVAAIKATTGLELNVEFAPRRPGDPPALVADPSKAAKILAWSPQYTQIEAIVATVVAAARRQRVANDGKADILVT